MKVYVTDGDQRSTLAVTRSLGRAGMQVIVGETFSPNLSSVSKYCSESTVYPSPFDDEKKYMQAIQRVTFENNVDFVIPMTDISTAILSQHSEDFNLHTVLAAPDNKTFWRASDKNTLHLLAERLGIPIPTLFYINEPEDIDKIKNDITFPCVLKPSRSRYFIDNNWCKSTVRIATTKHEFDSILHNDKAFEKPFMIQSIINGEGCAIFALCDHGKTIAMFSHKRLREKPPWGGVSVLRESIALEPIMAKHAIILLENLNWHGVAMVEFKRDSVNSKPYLMEINGRFWGSLQLAIDAGMNFPVMLIDLFTGKKISEVNDYYVGVRSRWLLGDLDHMVARLFNRNKNNVMLVPLYIYIFDFIMFWRKNMNYEVESINDFRPSFYEIINYIRAGIKSIARKK